MKGGQFLTPIDIKELGATNITTAHAVWNISSKRVMEKLGIKFVKENLNGFLQAGKQVP